MAIQKSTTSFEYSQPPAGLAAVAAILDTIDASALLARLWHYRWNARPGYPLVAMWRAYVASFIFNHRNTNELIRRLQDDADFRRLCGFTTLPHRTTFNRFIARLGHHEDLVATCLAGLTGKLAQLLPGFGEKVSVDSTVIRTHANPRRRILSDSEASWTAKADNRGEREWHFGYKYHALVDATFGVPITGFTTTAKRNDSPELPRLLANATESFDWFFPKYVMADRGYDSEANHQAVMSRGAIPVIAIRRTAGKGKLHGGIYDDDGAPTCIGGLSMQFVKENPEKGDLYRCQPGGCNLKNRRGVRHCQDMIWEKHQAYGRLFGMVRRGSAEWKALYSLRQSVERVFKSLKESRRLEGHCVRGFRQISLHSTMSVLTFQATALAHALAGELEDVRWMVRRVA